MTDARKTCGRRGEELAAAFLRERGFTVIVQNWNCRLGEIDLIVERAGQIRFVEVKTRYTTAYGYPEEAVTRTKLLHLMRAAELWMRAQPRAPKDYQIDVLAILALPGRPPDIRWIEGAWR